jgi:hypothetical protein
MRGFLFMAVFVVEVVFVSEATHRRGVVRAHIPEFDPPPFD